MSLVYFLRPIGTAGPIKIGCSVNPVARRATFETHTPWELEVAASTPGDLRLEGHFHRAFEHARMHREWFDARPEITALIDQINAGEFSPPLCSPEAPMRTSPSRLERKQ